MTFELHIWGPAFSLPSIDPHCLAALAYLSALAQRADEDLQWHVISSKQIRRIDDYEYTVGELPALVHGSTTISGLENIIAHLDAQTSPESLSPTQEADLTAFTSHILHRAPPLLALSLFVSTENYTAVTRPAYSTLLPWPTQYLVPPHLRSKAQAQTAHLGLISPDFVDDADQDSSDATARRRNRSIIPESLRTLGGSRQAHGTVTGALTQQPQVGSARFRLDALVDDFCAPLSELLGQDDDKSNKKGETRKKEKNMYLLSSTSVDQNDDKDTHPSSLDSLATAYLSLMLHPTLPQNWLASRIRQRWPTLVSYTQKMSEELWGGQRYEETIPWLDAASSSSSQKGSWMGTTSSFAAYALSGVPGFGGSTAVYAAPPLASSTATASTDSQSQQEQRHEQQPHSLPTVLLTATAAAAGLAAASTYFVLPYLSSSPTVEEGRQKRNLSEMGEAGAMLSGVDFGA